MCGPNAVSPIRNLATGIFFRCWFLEDHPYHPKKLALKNLATKLMPTATSGIHITQEIGHKRLRLWVSGGQRWWQTGCQTTQSPCRPGWIVRQWLCLQYQSCRIYRCSPCTRSHSSHGSDPLQMQPETTTKATKNFTIFCHWKIISSLPCILGSKSKVIGDPTPYTQVTIFIPQYKNEKMEKKKNRHQTWYQVTTPLPQSKKPQASTPQMPQKPCTGEASTGSSIFNFCNSIEDPAWPKHDVKMLIETCLQSFGCWRTKLKVPKQNCPPHWKSDHPERVIRRSENMRSQWWYYNPFLHLTSKCSPSTKPPTTPAHWFTCMKW